MTFFQKYSSLVLLIAVLVTIYSNSNTANAQYPDEICHWQCDIIDCDDYDGHCDYDCYEVCYPYRSTSGLKSAPLPRVARPPKSLNLRELVHPHHHQLAESVAVRTSRK